ncbi:MAG: GNAT family N-acetyltransferase [Acidobacteriota bacterium]
MLTIRKSKERDRPAIWELIRSVISTGDTYVFEPDSDEEEMIRYWFTSDKHVYSAEWDGRLIGTFWIKPNQPGFGSHVANAAYMVLPAMAGQGIGGKMAEFSIDEARRLGFTAMQFNFVVKSNEAAVHLWDKLGFEIIGEIPDAFRHPKLGLTNVYIMYRRL